MMASASITAAATTAGRVVHAVTVDPLWVCMAALVIAIASNARGPRSAYARSSKPMSDSYDSRIVQLPPKSFGGAREARSDT